MCGGWLSEYDGVMDEPPQVITGTLNVNLTDAQLLDLAVGLGIDVDALIAAHGGLDEEPE
jgi:hypothetical protein